jgi:hypothetical protein
VPCCVALFLLEEFFYVTLRFFLGTLSTQSIHRSAPTRLPPDLALSSILPFRRAPSFPLPLRLFFPLYFLQGAEEKNPPNDHPTKPPPPFDPDPPLSRHESLSRPIKQITVKSVPVPVPAPAFVCQRQHSLFTLRTRCVSLVSPGPVLLSLGSSGFPRLPAVARVPAETTIVCPYPLCPASRLLELSPVISTIYLRVADKQFVGHL